MKTSFAVRTSIFAALSVSTLAVPEDLMVPQAASNSWFGAFKESVLNDPAAVSQAFDDYFNGNGESQAEAFMKKSAVVSAAVLNDNAGDLHSQLLGSLTAKLSSISQQSEFEANSDANSIVSNIVNVFETIDVELSEDQFAAWSNFEQGENLKTRQLVNKVKAAFQNFAASSAISPKVVSQFLNSKFNELSTLKEQSAVSNSSYRTNLKFWIYQTLSMIQTFEGFSLSDNADLILREYSEIVSVSGADQEFIGEIIGYMLLAKIRPSMEAGNEEVAAQAVVDVIGDLQAYCSVIAGMISFCYFMSALPPACHIAVGVASLATVLLVFRTFRNLV